MAAGKIYKHTPKVIVPSPKVALGARQKKQVKKMIKADVERKYWVTTATGQYVDSTGFVLDLSPVPQGDTDISRDGDMLSPTSITFNMSSFLNNAVVTQAMIRVILFRWKQYDTVVPTPGDILLSGIGSIVAPLSSYVHDGRDKFEILSDKMHNITTWLNGASTQPFYSFMTKKASACSIKFLSGGTTGSNKIYALVIADPAAAAGANRPYISYHARLNFTDS